MRSRCPDVSDKTAGFDVTGDVGDGDGVGGTWVVGVGTVAAAEPPVKLLTGTRNEPVFVLMSRYFFLLASSTVPPGVVRLATTLASLPSG